MKQTAFILFRHSTRAYNRLNSEAYLKWFELTTDKKQEFVKGFVKNYAERYPFSSTNVSLRVLSCGMDKYHDSPSVFGIFYNDILHMDIAIDATHRFAHPSFRDLLYTKETASMKKKKLVTQSN